MKNVIGEPWRLCRCAIAGLSFLTVSLLLAGCRDASNHATEEAVDVGGIPAPGQSTLVQVPAIEPIGRGELLAAFAAAADETAAGKPLPRANLELANRAFEFRLPFGCGGGVADDWGKWSIDPKTELLRIRVQPQVWKNDPTITALAAGLVFDTAEGFWVDRPWTRSEQCPRDLRSEQATATLPHDLQSGVLLDNQSNHTVALVQYFSPDAPRTLRRGFRPYTYIGKIEEAGAPGPISFRLKLSGWLRGFADGQPIHCIIKAASSPPICAAAVEVTETALEDAKSGKSLTEWNN